MNKQTEVILKEIEKINQEILLLTQKVAKLEKNLLGETIKIVPRNKIAGDNFNKIMEGADIAMERLNKRGQK